MKRIINFVIALLISGNLFSQTPLSYTFRKPLTNGTNSWKFASVYSGIDAVVTVISSKNATVDKIDDSTVYANAWNPVLKYTSTTNNDSDSSYVEFKVEFIKRTNSAPSNQSILAMTLIDVDGNTNFREMVKTSLPAYSTGIFGSLLSISQNSNWLTVLGSTIDFPGIDTTVYKAMTQINFTNVNTFNVRMGVLGKIAANATRQHSYYFKGFTAMVVPLAVELIKFDAKIDNGNTTLKWETASEEHLIKFEVMRSSDGTNFTTIGEVNARGTSNEMLKYTFTDNEMLNISTAYYKLKMINMDGSYKMSNISKISKISLPVSVNVYPNPTSEFVNVDIDAEFGTDQITVVDCDGKILSSMINKEISNNSVRIDVTNLEKGIYFIIIAHLDETKTSVKFIKR